MTLTNSIASSYNTSSSPNSGCIHLAILEDTTTTHYSNTAHYIHVDIENLSRYNLSSHAKISHKTKKSLSVLMEGIGKEIDNHINLFICCMAAVRD